MAPVVWIGISGFGWSFFVILSGLAGAGIIPRIVPHHLMGTDMSTYRLFSLGIMPVARIGGGFLALATGVIPVLWVWALVLTPRPPSPSFSHRFGLGRNFPRHSTSTHKTTRKQ